MGPSHYVGLDVSQELTSVCVIDGKALWFGVANVPPILMPLPGRSASMPPASSEPGLRLGCCRTF